MNGIQTPMFQIDCSQQSQPMFEMSADNRLDCLQTSQPMFQMTAGKRVDRPQFPADGYSENAWKGHYTALAERRKTCEKRRLYKTSKEWFQLLYAKQFMILDIDGWRNLPDIDFYWNNVPITHVEFEQRYSQCTICPIQK